jgi:PAS domain S-box-containing protein
MMLNRFEDLEKYVSILVVDSDEFTCNKLINDLKASGYLTVLGANNINEAKSRLEKVNILLIKHVLYNRFFNGLKLASLVKKKYGGKIESAIILNEDDNLMVIDKIAKRINMFAAFNYPKDFYYLMIWLKEIGKRIWLQQILNNAPEEVLIRDKDGVILYVDHEKEKIYGKKLIGDKCFNRFEYRGDNKNICPDCPGIEVFNNGNIVRTDWDYYSRGDIRKHKIHTMHQWIDLVAAPLVDSRQNPIAIIEFSRDITIRKVIDTLIGKMEEEQDWERRCEIFIDGFSQFGIPRARFYLFNKNKFHLIQKMGNYRKKIKNNIDIFIKNDRPSAIIMEVKKPIIFRIDNENPNMACTKNKYINNVYTIGKDISKYLTHSKNKEWIDLPLLVSNQIIGKVSIDGWRENECPNTYDIEAIERYCATASQILRNAKTNEVILQRERTEKAILRISEQITNLIKSDTLLYNAVKLTCETMGTRDCSIFLYDEKDGLLKRIQSYGTNKYKKPIHNFPQEHFVPGQFITGKMYSRQKDAYKNRMDEIVDKVRKHIKTYKNNQPNLLPIINKYEEIFNEKIYNCIFAKLTVGNKNIGLIRSINKLQQNVFGEYDFTDNDLEMFKLLAAQIALAIQNTKLLQNTQDNENWFKVLFEKNPDGVVIIKPEGPTGEWPIKDCNTAFCKMNKYKKKELIGVDIDILNKYYNKLFIKNENIINALPNSRKHYYEKLKENPQLLQVIHRRPDESEIAVQTSTSLFKINEEEFIIGIDRDITESNRLYGIAKNVAQLTVFGNFNETINQVVNGTLALLNCDIVTLYPYNQTNGILRNPPTCAGDLLKPEGIKQRKSVEKSSVVYKMLRHEKPYIVKDTKNDKYFSSTRFTHEEKIKSLIAIPLSVKNQKVGIMFIAYRKHHEFTDAEYNNIILVANQAAVAICNAQLLDEIELKKEALENSVDKKLLSVFGLMRRAYEHRISNSIGYIKVRIEELLENQYEFDQKVNKILLSMLEATKEALDFRKETSEKWSKILYSREELIDFKRLIFDVKKKLKYYKHEKIKITFSGFDKLPAFRANYEIFQEGVILELILNAIKSIKSKEYFSGGKSISINGKVIDANISIIVKDNGCGIPKEKNNEIFNSGYSEWSNASGNGKGLYYLKSIIEFYRGSVSLESEVYIGTTFTILLPLNQQNNY